MKYWRFEVMVIVLGIAVVAASLVVGPAATTHPTEIVAQLLIVVVLVGAAHWGRDGGFIAAVVATVIYLVMSLPAFAEHGLTADAVVPIAVHVGIYAFVGIIGGDVCGRVKYLFARISADPLLDEETGVYSARYAAQAIRSGAETYQRYKAPYSVVRVTAEPLVFEELRPGRRRAVLRQIAGATRGAVRLVDDVAYAGDGVFLVLLPQTDATGAETVEERLVRDIHELLGAAGRSIATEVLSCADRCEYLLGLARSLQLSTESTVEPEDDVGEGERAEAAQDERAGATDWEYPGADEKGSHAQAQDARP